MSNKSTTLQLPIELTPAEKVDTNAELAKELLLRKALETTIAECKEAIKTHDGNIALRLKELEDNTKLAQVKCEWILYPDEVVKKNSPQIISGAADFTHYDGFTGLKRLIRVDTGGIIDELQMMPDDFQTELPLEGKDAKPKDKKTKKA